MMIKTREALQELQAKWSLAIERPTLLGRLSPEFRHQVEARLFAIQKALKAWEQDPVSLNSTEDRVAYESLRIAINLLDKVPSRGGHLDEELLFETLMRAERAVNRAAKPIGLSESDRVMSSAERRRDSLASLAKEAAGQAKSIQEMEREAKASLDVVDELRGRAIAEDALLATRQQEVKEQIDTLDHEAKSAQESLQKALTSLELVRKNARAEGLAKAFQDRSEALQVERRIWAIAFIGAISVLLLVAMVFTVELTVFNYQELTVNLLRRLGTIAPAVWFGWYAARQLGRISRVQEDYEFKAATALAYQSYRDEISALVNNEALKEKFAEVVIENFGNNPVRLYENTKHDDSVSPSEAMFKNLSPEQLAALCVDGLNRVQALLPKK